MSLWIRNLSHVATHLVVLVVLVGVIVILIKKVQGSVVPNGIGIKLGRIILQVNNQIQIYWRTRIFDLTSHFQDGGHDVISRRKVLSSGECIRSVRLAVCCTCNSVHQLSESNSSARDVTGSLYELQFLIHSTFVLLWSISCTSACLLNCHLTFCWF